MKFDMLVIAEPTVNEVFRIGLVDFVCLKTDNDIHCNGCCFYCNGACRDVDLFQGKVRLGCSKQDRSDKVNVIFRVTSKDGEGSDEILKRIGQDYLSKAQPDFFSHTDGSISKGKDVTDELVDKVIDRLMDMV